MEAGLVLTFFIAFGATFLGTIPFGPINLSVVNITLNKLVSKGFQFSLGAAFIEIFEALLAISFGVYIQRFLDDYTWIQLVVIALFMGIGIFYLLRKTSPKLVKNKNLKVGEFTKGIGVAIANPQALPFWFFMLTFIAQHLSINYHGAYLLGFLFGVFIGKLVALMLFVYLSDFLKKRLETSCKLINRTLGVILLLIGLIQAVKYYLA